jgi:hypothetical protein
VDILILGPRPAKSPFTPASFPSVINLDTIGPPGPWPLLICDRSVSAGYMYQYNMKEKNVCTKMKFT